jgi:hypothetical protein
MVSDGGTTICFCGIYNVPVAKWYSVARLKRLGTCILKSVLKAKPVQLSICIAILFKFT